MGERPDVRAAVGEPGRSETPEQSSVPRPPESHGQTQVPPQPESPPPAARRRTRRKTRKARKTWKIRLRSEAWRMVVSVLAAAILSGVSITILLVTGVLVPQTPGAAFNQNVSAPAVLSVFAFFGPSYLVLSNIIWRDLSGRQLRAELQRTSLPDKSMTRSWLVGSPVQNSSSAAMLSLAAVWILAIRPGAPLALLLISLACVVGSWVLVMATFSVEYAREWANSDGFEFSGDDERTFGDFAYLAALVSTTYSSSDVALVNRRARRLVMIHSITAFVFGTVILAFLVALVLNTLSG